MEKLMLDRTRGYAFFRSSFKCGSILCSLFQPRKFDNILAILGSALSLPFVTVCGFVSSFRTAIISSSIGQDL
jgi:hypothetical protein